MNASIPIPYNSTTKSGIIQSGIVFRQYGIQYKITHMHVIGSYQITIYQCQKCQTFFVARKDLFRHTCHLMTQGMNNFVFNAAKTTKCLLEMIAVNNYSFESIGSPTFRNFIESFGRDYEIPSPDKIAREMHTYAETIQRQVIEHLKHHVVTLLIDGGTRSGRHYDGILLWTIGGIHFYSLEDVPNFKTLTLSDRLAKVIQFLRANEIIVIAACSDNASNNIALFNEYNINSLFNQLTDFDLLRIPCCAHVINLAVSDTIYLTFKIIYKMVKGLLKRAPKNKKIPKFTKVRWYSFFTCVLFIYEHPDIFPKNDPDYDFIEKEIGWDLFSSVSRKVIELIALVESDSVELSSVFPMISSFIGDMEDINNIVGHLGTHEFFFNSFFYPLQN